MIKSQSSPWLTLMSLLLLFIEINSIINFSSHTLLLLTEVHVLHIPPPLSLFVHSQVPVTSITVILPCQICWQTTAQ